MIIVVDDDIDDKVVDGITWHNRTFLPVFHDGMMTTKCLIIEPMVEPKSG